MKIDAHGVTDVGCVRERNEDAFVVHRPGSAEVGVYVVADGVGGQAAGHVASRMFTEEIARRLRADPVFRRYDRERERELRQGLLQRLRRLCSDTNRELYKRASEDPELRGMATTGDVLVALSGAVALAHVGDSRAYLVRQGQIFRMTEDHTVANQGLRAGLFTEEELPHVPFAHALTRSYGPRPEVEIDTLFFPTGPGDRFVLCSDGITKHMRGGEILEFGKGLKARKAAETIVAECRSRGGLDNLTCVIVDIGAEPGTVVTPRLSLGDQLDLMGKLFLFEHLSRQELMRVLRIAYVEDHLPGDLIVKEGASGDVMYLVLAGELEVHLKDEHLNTISTGGHFGELALVGDQQRSATVEAMTEASLLAIARQDLERLMDEEPRLAVGLLRGLLAYSARQVNRLSSRVVELSKLL